MPKRYKRRVISNDSKRGPPGIGFKLTKEGNFDMEDKRLTNIKNPKNDKDAINKIYLIEKTKISNEENNALILKADGLYTSKSLELENDKYNAKNKIISNVSDPINSKDAINKKYLEDIFYLDNKKNPDFRNKRLTNIADPTFPQNAATKNYVDTKALIDYDAKNNRIINIGKAQYSKDAITKEYLDEIFTTGIDWIDFGGKRLTSVGEPTFDANAATKKYVNQQISKLRNQKYFEYIHFGLERVYEYREIESIPLLLYKTYDYEYVFSHHGKIKKIELACKSVEYIDLLIILDNVEHILSTREELDLPVYKNTLLVVKISNNSYYEIESNSYFRLSLLVVYE